MEREAVVDAVVLRSLPGVGDRAFKTLVDSLGTARAVLAASPGALCRAFGAGSALTEVLGRAGHREAARREVDRAHGLGFAVIPYGTPEYPRLLSEIHDPPSLLYVAGAVEEGDERAVAIVGSRRASTHGVRFARALAADLAAAGVTVISGLAEGIDAAAHGGALAAGGRTLAVFGAGLDVIYPGWNAALAQSVRAQGAWLSELPLGSEPKSHHFPRRNRIISGLSLGVVVVEAADRSGSLITANCALDQGREVFAVPGLPRAFNSRGAHRLLRSGAKLVEGAADVLAELPPRLDPRPPAPTPPVLQPPPRYRHLWEALEDVPLDIDTVAARAGVGAAEAAAGMMELVLEGFAEAWPGKRYTRNR